MTPFLTSPHPYQHQVLLSVPYLRLCCQCSPPSHHQCSLCPQSSWTELCCFYSFILCAYPLLHQALATCGLLSSILRSSLPQGLHTGFLWSECLLLLPPLPPSLLLANAFTPFASQVECHFLPDVFLTQDLESPLPQQTLSYHNLKFCIYFTFPSSVHGIKNCVCLFYDDVEYLANVYQ